MQELNRALLARQGLLERAPVPARELIEHLVGVQAQVPEHPYASLWARTAGFDPAELSRLVARRAAVRAGVMRATVHLLSARDLHAIEPLTRPVVAATFRAFAAGLRGRPVEPVVAAARELLTQRPMTRKQLSDALAPAFPGADPQALGYAAVTHLPVRQVPPRGEWGGTLQATWELFEGPAAFGIDELMLRYLRAFGPATVADARAWSRLSGLRAVFERLRPRLRTFRDERGRELFDVPDGILVDPDTPAPPRLLPQFDNVLLGHDDRSRIGIDRLQDLRARWIGHVLVDGYRAGHWRLEHGVLTLHAPRRADLEAEAVGLLALLAPGAEPRISFAR